MFPVLPAMLVILVPVVRLVLLAQLDLGVTPVRGDPLESVEMMVPLVLRVLKVVLGTRVSLAVLVILVMKVWPVIWANKALWAKSVHPDLLDHLERLDPRA